MLAGVVPMLARFPDKFAGNGSFRPKLEVSLGHGTTIQLDGVDGDPKVVQDDFLVSLFRSYNGLMIAGAIQDPPSLREASPFTCRRKCLRSHFDGRRAQDADVVCSFGGLARHVLLYQVEPIASRSSAVHLQ